MGPTIECSLLVDIRLVQVLMFDSGLIHDGRVDDELFFTSLASCSTFLLFLFENVIGHEVDVNLGGYDSGYDFIQSRKACYRMVFRRFFGIIVLRLHEGGTSVRVGGI